MRALSSMYNYSPFIKLLYLEDKFPPRLSHLNEWEDGRHPMFKQPFPSACSYLKGLSGGFCSFKSAGPCLCQKYSLDSRCFGWFILPCRFRCFPFFPLGLLIFLSHLPVCNKLRMMHFLPFWYAGIRITSL